MAGKYTFWKLLSDYQIEIPVIQRDYAQGRKSASAIRKSFVKSMKLALAEAQPMDMNFVYGSIEDGGQFIPIDGQQRLTTLFLLHLYLVQATGKDPKDYPEFEKFTYKTRISSSYFCECISKNKIVTAEGFSLKDVDNLKDEIIDKPWFGTSWKNDPTVDAMLNMLQTIHFEIGQRDDLESFWEQLIDYDKCPLYFFFLNLGEYNLEDSIYIKMNARGKALTDYENFKAKLEKFLKDRAIPEWEEMATKLDRNWTEVFWNCIDDSAFEKENGDVTFDDKIMYFIVNYIYNEFACNTATSKRDDLRREIDWLFSLSNVEFTNEFAEFETKFDGKKIDDSFIDMFTVFDLMISGKDIKEYAKDNGYIDEKKIFTSIIEPGQGINSFTPQTRTWFYAYTRFLLNNRNHIGDAEFEHRLTEWFRVIKHLIDGQYFMGLDEYVHVIHGINWLADHSYDIVNFLSTFMLDGEKDTDSDESELNLPFFNKYVFREECLKASLMALSDEWNQAIRAAESNPYFDGDVNGALEYAGITNEEQKPTEWDSEKTQKYLQEFIKYTAYLDALFNRFDTHLGLDKKVASIFRRALLTKGDFSMKYKQNMSMLVDRSNPRGDVTWKRLFRPQRGQEFVVKRGYIKALFDDPNFDIANVVGSCKKIIDAYKCDNLELKYFIEVPELMDFVIGLSGDNKGTTCWNFYRNSDQTKFLLWTTRLSGWNYDYYKYALYCVLKRENSSHLLKMGQKCGIHDVINEPIYIKVDEDEIYSINWVRDAKQYRITGGKKNIDETKDSLDEMVQYIKSRNLLVPDVSE